MKENKKEEIDIYEGKVCYAKIYSHNKILPLTVNIEVKYGTIETCVSRTKEKPSVNNCDYYFSSHQFEIDFGTNNDDVKCIYFAINALKISKISVICTFKVKAKEEKKTEDFVKLSKVKLKKVKSKGIYEFLGKPMTIEEQMNFEEMISKLKNRNFYNDC